MDHKEKRREMNVDETLMRWKRLILGKLGPRIMLALLREMLDEKERIFIQMQKSLIK